VFRVALALILAAALGALPSLVRADVYRWVDETGATHYATSRDAVPRAFRDAAEVIPAPPATIPNPSGESPPPPPARPAAAPAPAPAPVAPAVEPGAPALAPAPAPAPEVAPAPATAPTTAPSAVPAEGAPSSESGAQAAPAAAPPPAPGAPPAQAAGAHPQDPRAQEIAQLEGQLERDREVLRQLISTRTWDSAELAADPRVREIAERMPRLQAELAALRTEAER